MADFLLSLGYGSKRLFCASWGGYTCLLIFVHIGEMSYGGYFEERAWLSHLATLNNDIHTMCSGLDCR